MGATDGQCSLVVDASRVQLHRLPGAAPMMRDERGAFENWLNLISKHPGTVPAFLAIPLRPVGA